MTPTEAAIKAEMDRATVDGVVRVSVALMNELLAQRDRYEKALREIDGLLDGTTSMTRHIKKLAQKALRCE